MSNAGFSLTSDLAGPAAPPAGLPESSEAKLRRRGILFVVSAPSGAGKSTLLNALRPTADFVYSVSCTTRPPRPDEADGRDYYFLTREQFEERSTAGLFLECANVHGNFYGTLVETVLHHLDRGTDVLVEIDTQGAGMIRHHAQVADAVADVFILPPSMAELRRRLERRGTETREQIEVRLQNAHDELGVWRDYRYALVSGSVEEDVQNFRAIMRAERQRTSRLFYR